MPFVPIISTVAAFARFYQRVMKKLMIQLLILLSVTLTLGCEVMPVTRYKPTLHNPFPQLTNVAVVPFYNETGNETVNGREFAKGYANELQRVTGFRVIANEQVEKTMILNELHKLETVDDIRYLAQLLEVDAIIIGKIHDFSMYYPPRCKLSVEWYSVNPYLHPIPRGYGLPWGTEFEGEIPDKILLETEMEIATAQIKTQTPDYEPVPSPAERLQRAAAEKNRRSATKPESVPKRPVVNPKTASKTNPIRLASATLPNNLGVQEMEVNELMEYAEYRQEQFVNRNLELTGVPYVPNAPPMPEHDRKKEALMFDPQMPHPLHNGPWPTQWSDRNQYPMVQQNQMNPGTYQGHYPGYPVDPNLTPEQLAQYGWINQPVQPIPPMYATMPGIPVEGQPGMVMGEPERFPGLPSDWPDPRGLIPEGPQAEKPVRKQKSDAPVLSHIAIYKGNDSEFMQALQDYDFLFRDDKRIAGKQSILSNRSEFVEFCCRLHIWEMFSIRGGAGRAEKVVREWKLWHGGEKPY